MRDEITSATSDACTVRLVPVPEDTVLSITMRNGTEMSLTGGQDTPVSALAVVYSTVSRTAVNGTTVADTLCGITHASVLDSVGTKWLVEMSVFVDISDNVGSCEASITT